ncbi:hypothetical protein PHYPO_G00021330 [Pangasianodon hypophthalmus]|uniref:Uncharacterized protein n=1 Tax=Pangasianodon hypophthalmus TaxID=310915 RepID=A0A5N5MV27_PANHP|nr:hypothetical protein PHYPO_G00021330 [Pangasianodon hypophthalmus]
MTSNPSSSDFLTLPLSVHPSSSPRAPALFAHDLFLLLLLLIIIRSPRALSHPSSSSSLTLSNCALSLGNFQQLRRKHLSQKSAASAGGFRCGRDSDLILMFLQNSSCDISV